MTARRRSRRGPAADRASDTLPADLAAGPCLEDWAPRGLAPRYAGPAWETYRAKRNWEAAVLEWAEETGWATEKRPAGNALGLARTRLPWSRAFLRSHGELDLLAFYEGRLQEHPGRDRHGWDVEPDRDTAPAP